MNKVVMMRDVSAIKKIYHDLFVIYPYKISLCVETYTESDTKGKRYAYAEFGSNAYLSMNYYLTIAQLYKPENGYRDEFRIGKTNYWEFMVALENASKWILNASEIYAKLDSTGEYKAIAGNPIKINGMWDGMTLELLPATNVNGTVNEFGVGMYINDGSDMIFVNASLFMNICYFFKSYNLNNAAMLLMNYLGRPEVRDEEQQTTTFNYGASYNKPGFLERTGAKPTNVSTT